MKEFLAPQNFECFKLYSQVDEAKLRPFIAYKNLRNVKRSDPKDCQLIWDETLAILFIKKSVLLLYGIVINFLTLLILFVFSV